MIPLQALAHQHLHPVCHTLLCLRHLRHVSVLPAQDADQRARGRWRQVAGSHCVWFPATRGAVGAASRLHGGLLLPCLSGNVTCTHFSEKLKLPHKFNAVQTEYSSVRCSEGSMLLYLYLKTDL